MRSSPEAEVVSTSRRDVGKTRSDSEAGKAKSTQADAARGSGLSRTMRGQIVFSSKVTAYFACFCCKKALLERLSTNLPESGSTLGRQCQLVANERTVRRHCASRHISDSRLLNADLHNCLISSSAYEKLIGEAYNSARLLARRQGLSDREREEYLWREGFVFLYPKYASIKNLLNPSGYDDPLINLQTLCDLEREDATVVNILNPSSYEDHLTNARTIRSLDREARRMIPGNTPVFPRRTLSHASDLRASGEDNSLIAAEDELDGTTLYSHQSALENPDNDRAFHDALNARAMELAHVLAGVEGLQELCEGALAVVGPHVLLSYIVDLLQVYQADLKDHAGTALERRVSARMQGWESRARAAGSLLDHCSGNNADAPAVQSLGLKDLVNVSSPNLDTLEEDFLTKGQPMQRFLSGLRIPLLPPELEPLTRIIITIPTDDIHFLDEDQPSIIDRVKSFFETISGTGWNWWPLKASKAPLLKGYTRLTWRCHCGQIQWTELSAKHADEYRRFIHLRGHPLYGDHLCRSICVERQWGDAPQPPTSWPVFNTPIQAAQAPSPSAHSTQLSRPAPSYQGFPQNTKSTSSFNQGQQNSGQLVSAPQSFPSRIPVSSSLGVFVLLGVRRGRPALRLCHVNTEENPSDRKFFIELKTTYRALRGSVRWCLSIWQLSHCDFVKFKYSDALGVFSYAYDLPDSPDYDYHPRKPVANNPPINKHEFEAALSACKVPCRLAWLGSLHTCYPSSTRRCAQVKIPKKRKEWDYLAAGRDNDLAWGLEACHAISALRVFTYNILMLMAPFGFWSYWQGVNPKDMQNASIPAAVCVSLITLFWTLSGIIQVLREPLASKT